ncbi:MAG: HEAT repeat domain-containing protein, partial [Gammaproteobacteria bacterium]|nr:HEAT repeat domain-containing protein [Gammaproteobacteria bacterium]
MLRTFALDRACKLIPRVIPHDSLPFYCFYLTDSLENPLKGIAIMKRYTEQDLSLFLTSVQSAVDAREWVVVERQLARLTWEWQGAWSKEALTRLFEHLQAYIEAHLTDDRERDVAFIRALDVGPAERKPLQPSGLRDALLHGAFPVLPVETKISYARFFVPYYLRYQDYPEALRLLSACGFGVSHQPVSPADLPVDIRASFGHLEGALRVRFLRDTLRRCQDTEEEVGSLKAAAYLMNHAAFLVELLPLLPKPLQSELAGLLSEHRLALRDIADGSLQDCLNQEVDSALASPLSPEEKMDAFQAVSMPIAAFAQLLELLGSLEEAHCYWFALVRYAFVHGLTSLASFSAIQANAQDELNRLERVILKQEAPNVVERRVDSLWLVYRASLQTWRQSLDEAMCLAKGDNEALKTLFEQNQSFLTCWLITLFQDAERIAGTSPWGFSYGVLGGGSFSFGRLSPYSAMEICIIIPARHPEHEAYLQHVLTWVSWSLESLGESLWVAGLRLARSWVVKTLDEWQAEFTQAAEPLAHHRASHSENLRLLQYLQQGIWLHGYGDIQALQTAYQAAVSSVLDQSFPLSRSPTLPSTYRQALGLTVLAETLSQCQALLDAPFELEGLLLPFSSLLRQADTLFTLLQVLNVLGDIKASSVSVLLDALVLRGFARSMHTALEALFYRLQALAFLPPWALEPIDSIELVKSDLNSVEKGVLSSIQQALSLTDSERADMHLTLHHFLAALYPLRRPLTWQQALPPAGQLNVLMAQTLAGDARLSRLQAPPGQGRFRLSWLSLKKAPEHPDGWIAESRTLLLHPKVAPVFLNPHQRGWRDKGEYDALGNHVVFRGEYQDVDWHVKLGANFPGLDLAAYVFKALLTEEVLPVYIGKLSDDTWAILPEVATLTPTLPYQNVAETMAQSTWSEDQLDPYYFSLYTVLAGLLNPYDAKPNNHIWVPFFNETGQLRYAMVDVDNEQCFQTAVVREGKDFKPTAKSIYFCCDRLKDPLHPAVIDLFLSLNPFALLSQWLTLLAVLDKGLHALFGEAMITALATRQAEKKSTGAILLAPETVGELFDKLQRLQEGLARYKAGVSPALSHLDVLHQLEPAMKGQYERMLPQAIPPAKRFEILLGYAYSKVIGFSFCSRYDRALLQRSGIQQKIPTLDEILARSTYAPEQSLQYLEKRLADYELNVKPCQAALLNGDLTLWEQTYAPAFRERVVQGLDFKIFSKQPKPIQARFKQGALAIAFRIVDLSYWMTLTDKDIETLVKHAWQLTELRVRGCPRLTTKTLTNLLAISQTLEVLDMSEHSTLETIQSGLLTTLSFLQLRRLTVERCPQLKKIDVDLPQLRELYVSDNPQLLTLQTHSTQLYLVQLRGATRFPLAALSALSLSYSLLQTVDLIDCSYPTTFIDLLHRYPFLVGCDWQVSALEDAYLTRIAQALDAAYAAIGYDDKTKRLQRLHPTLAQILAKRSLVRTRLGLFTRHLLEDKALIMPLLKAAKSENGDVRRDAAEALGRFAQTPQTTTVVAALLVAVEDKYREVRRSAAAALGQFAQTPQATTVVAALLAAVKD